MCFSFILRASATLSTYWARHSWATIAAEIEIPKETIALLSLSLHAFRFFE